MTLIKIQAGKEDYNRAWGVSIVLFGAEAYVSRTRRGVWTVGVYSEWPRFSWDKTWG